MQGGNMTGTLTTDLGTEVIKAIDDEALAKYKNMSVDERKALYFKDGFDLKFNQTYSATFRGNNYKGKHALKVPYECKAPSGERIFTAKVFSGVENLDHWMVEHKPAPMIDYVPVGMGGLFGEKTVNTSDSIKKEMIKKYSGYEAYFDDWNNGFLEKNNKQKLGTNYRMRNTFNFMRKFETLESMSKLADVNFFCEATGGQFIKNGKPFRTFLKEFYMNGADPISYNMTSPFKGSYACINAKEPFVMELDQVKSDNQIDVRLDYALIKKGAPDNQVISNNFVSNVVQVSSNQVQQPVVNNANNGQNEVMNTMMQKFSGMFGGMMPQRGMGAGMAAQTMGVDQNDANLIVNAVASKAPYGSQQGANISTALYSGKDGQGCDLVALEKSVVNMPNSKRVHNYKICNGQIVTLGETGLSGIPRKAELDPLIAQVKKQCKAYGAFGSQYQDITVSCRTLDANHCSLETTIMQNGTMLDKKVENSCQ